VKGVLCAICQTFPWHFEYWVDHAPLKTRTKEVFPLTHGHSHGIQIAQNKQIDRDVARKSQEYKDYKQSTNRQNNQEGFSKAQLIGIRCLHWRISHISTIVSSVAHSMGSNPIGRNDCDGLMMNADSVLPGNEFLRGIV